MSPLSSQFTAALRRLAQGHSGAEDSKIKEGIEPPVPLSRVADTEKPTSEFQLPRSAVRWAVVGLGLTSSVVILISLFSGVTPQDLARIGYLAFGLAAAASSARLLVQILRFKVITVGLVGDQPIDLSGLATARVGSEFISLSTPSTSMGVFVRSAWLSRKGVNAGKALWMGGFEVLIEIFVGASIALSASAYAFSRGATAIGSAIGVVALILLIGSVAIVFIAVPALRVVRFPRTLSNILARVMGAARARQLESVAQEEAQRFHLAARAILNRDSLPLVIKAVGLTLLEDLLGGAALWIVLTSAGFKIDPFSTTLAVYGVFAVAQIPVTIGGAGIAELTMQAYLSSVYGFSASWASVVTWRIASYQVLLGISGIAFLMLLRGVMRSSKAPQKP